MQGLTLARQALYYLSHLLVQAFCGINPTYQPWLPCHPSQANSPLCFAVIGSVCSRLFHSLHFWQSCV
jgi:hypothetical protein